jgi:hypothetical protein
MRLLIFISIILLNASLAFSQEIVIEEEKLSLEVMLSTGDTSGDPEGGRKLLQSMTNPENIDEVEENIQESIILLRNIYNEYQKQMFDLYFR